MAARRAELVALTVEDITFAEQGLLLRIARSKGDQEGKGEDIAIQSTRVRDALRKWLRRAHIQKGPIFRAVNRHGHISGNGLTPRAVAIIVKRWCKRIGLDEALYAGHSLRAGLATTAALAGAHERDIQKQTRYRSTAMLRRYIRVAEAWKDNVTKLMDL